MHIMIGIAISVAALVVLGAAITGLLWWISAWRNPEAYIYVPEGVAMAEWQYKQLPMKECKFCGSEVNLNRHHVISQLACPERKNDPENLIVLCRHCHQVVGHKNNWKKFNPYVAEICEKYGGPPVDSREWREQHKEG